MGFAHGVFAMWAGDSLVLPESGIIPFFQLTTQARRNFLKSHFSLKITPEFKEKAIEAPRGDISTELSLKYSKRLKYLG